MEMPVLIEQLGAQPGEREMAPAKLTHGSLFTGIGGMDYGLEIAGFEPRWQVEKNPFCRKVLEKLWPNVPKFDDVRECGNNRRYQLERVDIISAGFPCQDVSNAGKRKGLGTPDNPTRRSGLWFEVPRIVVELRPRWVLVENVYRLKSDGADRVLADMEQIGYTCLPVIVGAENLGAPHERKRVWVLCRQNDAPLS